MIQGDRLAGYLFKNYWIWTSWLVTSTVKKYISSWLVTSTVKKKDFHGDRSCIFYENQWNSMKINENQYTHHSSKHLFIKKPKVLLWENHIFIKKPKVLLWENQIVNCPKSWQIQPHKMLTKNNSNHRMFFLSMGNRCGDEKVQQRALATIPQNALAGRQRAIYFGP